MDTKRVKSIADKEVRAHEARMHKGKGMKAGGVTGQAMRSMGRNVARARNQKSGG
jgi:hypothetical protein